jgi:perosamine synthetase
LEQRNKVLEALRERGIQAKNYFPPVLLQPFMAERFAYEQGDFPVTESVCKGTISLPFYNNLTKEKVAIVCRELKAALDKILPAG